MEVEPLGPRDPFAGGGVALLLGLARLDLPAASGGAWFDQYRNNQAWRWRYERIRGGAPFVAAEIDLRTDLASAAAQLCREVRIDPLAQALSDRCTIEMIVDQIDGWPIAAHIVRSIQGPNRTNALESLTFERLQADRPSR